MVITRKEVMWEHEAIREQTKFLGKLVHSLKEQTSGIVPSYELLNKIGNFRWSLYDFRDAVNLHIELDECFFKTLFTDLPDDAIAREHDDIKNYLNRAIFLAEDAVYKKLPLQELKTCAIQIKNIVDGVCSLIKSHTLKEDHLITNGNTVINDQTLVFDLASALCAIS